MISFLRPLLAPAAVLISTALLMTGCAVTSTPTSSPTTAATPVAGYTVDQISHDDPALPIHIQWPVVTGAGKLTAALSDWAKEQERTFIADNKPNASTPPELTGWWEFVIQPGPLVGVRMHRYEFTGADGAGSSHTRYGDSSSDHVWASAELIDANLRPDAIKAIMDALRAAGHQPDAQASNDPDVQERLLNDLSFAADGSLVVRVDEGLVTPYSDGPLIVTVSRQVSDPLLSQVGQRIRNAMARATTSPTSTSRSTVAPSPVTPPKPGKVDCAVVKCVALTFDDGPGPYTARLLDQLKAADAKATFFVLGPRVRAYPDVVRRQVAEGMAIGNHSFTHRQFTRLSAVQQAEELRRTDDALAAVGVSKPTLMRPPYGSYNATTKTLGRSIILWDVDTLDWKHRNAQQSISIAMKQVKPGSIILMHDIHAASVDAVPGLIRELRKQGYTLVTVPQLLDNEKPGQVYTRRA